MREATRDLLIGTCSIIAIIGLAAMLFLFGELDHFINPKYTVTLLTDDAAGLRAGSAVELHGVPIGRIDRIEVHPRAEYRVRITALIKEDERIPKDVRPYATTPLIGSSALLQFERAIRDAEMTPGQDPSTAPPGSGLDIDDDYLATDGSAIITGDIRLRLLEQITSQLEERMGPVIDALANFGTLSGSLESLSSELVDVLKIQSEEDLAAGEPPNLRAAVARLNTTLDTIETSFSTANEALELARDWLGDEQLRADITRAVSDAVTLIERAGRSIETYTTLAERYTLLADTLEVDAAALTARLVETTDEVSRTLEATRRVMTLATDPAGPGTMSQLLHNPDLYRSLTDASLRMERTLREMELLIQKLRAEGIRVGL